MESTKYQDSFSIGISSKQGAIKVYFDDDNAEEKIKLAKSLYYKYVEIARMKREM